MRVTLRLEDFLVEGQEREELLQRVAGEPFGARHHLFEHLAVPFGETLDDRVGEGALAFEVMEEGALGDACAAHHGVDRGGAEPGLQDQRLRGVEDPFPGFFGVPGRAGCFQGGAHTYRKVCCIRRISNKC